MKLANVNMVDTYAAARMELSATDQDAGTKLTDDEMGHFQSGAGAVGRQIVHRWPCGL